MTAKGILRQQPAAGTWNVVLGRKPPNGFAKHQLLAGPVKIHVRPPARSQSEPTPRDEVALDLARPAANRGNPRVKSAFHRMGHVGRKTPAALLERSKDPARYGFSRGGFHRLGLNRKFPPTTGLPLPPRFSQRDQTSTASPAEPGVSRCTSQITYWIVRQSLSFSYRKTSVDITLPSHARPKRQTPEPATWAVFWGGSR
jgi:hypothetical protein